METAQIARRRRTHSLETKMQVIDACKKGEAVSAIGSRLNLNPCVIYNWINKFSRDGSFTSSGGNKEPEAMVAAVIDDIKSGRTRERAFSLADDFGVSSAASNNSNIEVKFCPCCGTNMQAVRVALQTYQEVSQR
jgi:transposase-like protein